MIVTRILSITGAFALLSTIAFGQPGNLDGDFDADGKLTIDFGAGDESCNAVAVQADGKILVAGTVTDAPVVDFALLRLNIDGTADNTFSTDGIVTTDFGDWDEATSIAIQSDGKIVVAGSAFNGSTFELAMARYNSDGTLDNSFGTAGKVTTDVGFGDDHANAIAIQPDGKILISGGTDASSGSGDFVLVRYNANGVVDGSFGSGGIVITDFGASAAMCYGLGIQTDGKVVLSGGVTNGTGSDFATVRHNTDGSLDLTFSVDGIVETSIGPSTDIAHKTLIQADGKILVAGFTVNGIDADVALVRYNADGTFDTSFDLDGKATYDSGTGDDGAYGATLQGDGKIVVVGSQDGGSEPDFMLLRYETDGTLDASFGLNGLVITDFGQYAVARDVTIDNSGKIVVAGTVTDGGNDEFAVARYVSGYNIGVADLEFESNSVLVYPNPVQDAAFLEYTLLEDQQLRIELFDMSGRVLETLLSETERSAGAHKEVFRMKGLTSGNYILKIQGLSGSLSIKIQKQ